MKYRHLRIWQSLVLAGFVAGWTPAAGDPQGEAAFHLIKISEVFPGTVAQPGAQYVELQAYALGENFTNGHKLFFFNAAGVKVDSVTFTNVANGANQMKILIMTAQADALFGVNRDFTMTAAINPAGGKICWDATNLDCFAWGNYSGSPAGVGNPFQAALGLLPGKAAIRRLDISGSSTVLDALDDTGDSENDFNPGSPSPTNNANANGTAPASTCGNGAIEGLEQCDDGNTTAGDGCNSVCDDEFCGDGVTQTGEECDDGNLVAGDGCDPLCQLEPACGDGTVDAGEECDDGNLIDGDGCDQFCQLEPVCGDGTTEGGEECDDGNLIDGDGCNQFCQIEGSCPVTQTGDVNQSGTLTSADVIALVNYVFKAGPAPQPCVASGDVNCSGTVTSSDIIFLVNHVFKGQAGPCDVCTLVPAQWSCP